MTAAVFVASGIPNLSQSIRQNIISANGGDGITIADTGESGDRAVRSVQVLENRIGVGATPAGSADVALGNAGSWGSQAVDLSPAQGAVIEFVMPEDGLYPMVTHAFNFVGRGALGLFQAGDGDPLN